MGSARLSARPSRTADGGIGLQRSQFFAFNRFVGSRSGRFSPHLAARGPFPKGDGVSIWVIVLTVLLAINGCGRSDLPTRARVEGSVTFEGQPLNNGTISFVPDRNRGTTGRSATGVIGPDGRFQLRSFEKDDGALVGFHRVQIESWANVPEPPLPNSDGLPQEPRPPKSAIPRRYNDAMTSGLTAEVKAGEKNEYVFALTSKP